jgi:DNA-binding winged helix-turn-helix (wHTH) protein
MGEALDFRFADFEIDIARRELRRGGAVVHIEPQVFDLLVHLIRSRDRIVSKDELIEVIWHGRIVSEAALSSRISAARRVLGDSGNDQTLIRTMYKRGFRLSANSTQAFPSGSSRAIRIVRRRPPMMRSNSCRPPNRCRFRTSLRSRSCPSKI